MARMGDMAGITLHRGDVINYLQLLQQGCGDGEEQPAAALLATCGHGSCNTSWSVSKGRCVCRKACAGFRGGRAHCWKEKGNESCQSRMHQARKCPELHAAGGLGKREAPGLQAQPERLGLWLCADNMSYVSAQTPAKTPRGHKAVCLHPVFTSNKQTKSHLR